MSARFSRDRRVAAALERIRIHACEEGFGPPAVARTMGVSRTHAPFVVRGLFFRPWSNAEKPRPGRNVEKLYNAPAEGRWLLPDGSQWGVTTHDFEGFSAMRLWTSPEGVQHPDVAFRLPVPAVLASGETLTPGFPVGALLSLKQAPAKQTTFP